MTTWGENVTPENAWREYPRPQLKRTQWQNLNGLWDYSIVSKESAEPATFDGKILVPYPVESALSGVGKSVLPEQRLWYKKTFQIPADWKGQNVTLHFEGVDWESTIWLNEKKVGTHKGGSTAFSFDITRFLKRGPQELVVSVWDPTDQGTQPRGKQVLKPQGIWYTPVTGIWKTVWLEPVSQTSVLSVNPVADIDKNQIYLQTKFTGIQNEDKINVRIVKDKKVIAEKSFAPSAKFVLDVPAAKLWTPDSPELYQLELTLTRNNKELDKANSYFAMRKVSIVQDKQGF